MGNTKSNTKDLPPPYKEINNDKQIIDVEPIIDDLLEKPITAETIIKARQEFKDKQLEAYEANFKSARNGIIKSINENLSAVKMNDKFEVKLWLICGWYNGIDIKYQDDNLKKLYLKKRMDFIKNMYPRFKITITNENSERIDFTMTLKES